MSDSAYIVFEGVDGSGKSTQLRRLKERLEGLGLKPVLLREPTDGPYGREIRERARSGPTMTIDDELRLFIEDRRQHVREAIEPALAVGRWLLQDRSFYSTVAYQGARQDSRYGVAELLALNDFAPRPELVVLLDLPAEVAAERIAQRGVADAFETLGRLRRVRENFLALADERFLVIRAEGRSEDDIAAELWNRLRSVPLPWPESYKGEGS